MTTIKHYQIRKRVICDIIDSECVEEQDITISIKPDCKECKYYFDWKQSKLSIKEYVSEQHNAFLDYYISGRDLK